MTPISTPFSGRLGRRRLYHQALPLCRAACARPRPASPARDQRGRGLHDRPVRVSARLEAAVQSQGQQGPLDREGELDPALPLPRRPAAGIAGEAVAGGLGLQFGSHHAHARDAHLSTTAKIERHAAAPTCCSLKRVVTNCCLDRHQFCIGITDQGIRSRSLAIGADDLDSRGRPPMCHQRTRPSLGGEAGGRSPGFILASEVPLRSGEVNASVQTHGFAAAAHFLSHFRLGP